MCDPASKTKRSRLQAAGWIYLEGWVPEWHMGTDEAREWIAVHAEGAERIANTPQERGRPRKEPKP
jgi:hypothetical protein